MGNCIHDFNVPHVLIIFQTSAALFRTLNVRICMWYTYAKISEVHVLLIMLIF